jgi:hypothetical protein
VHLDTGEHVEEREPYRKAEKRLPRQVGADVDREPGCDDDDDQNSCRRADARKRESYACQFEYRFIASRARDAWRLFV